MRLFSHDRTEIKKALAEFDARAKVYLFGSRANDNKKGGDIDLLIFSNKITLGEKIKLRVKLREALGDQKIDIVIPNERNKAFVALIKEEAVLL